MEHDPFQEIRKLIAEWDASQVASNGPRNPPLSWLALRDMDFNYDWLVERVWPIGAHLHVFAAPKTGKSLLMLWIAASIAIGRDPFTWEPMKRHRVSYIDNEMTLKDVYNRVTDMALAFEELEGWLMYHPYPHIAPMDTESGGRETLEMMKDDESEVLIIDTLSRVVIGEENSNDTYRRFHNFTGRLLKEHQISVCRLDHAGHDPKKSRGASAKADDVDVVYGLEKRQLANGDNGYRLNCTHARDSVAMEVELALKDEPVSIKGTVGRSWTSQALQKARELDSLGASVDISKRDATALLKGAGMTVGKGIYLLEALKYRQMQAPFREFGL